MTRAEITKLRATATESITSQSPSNIPAETPMAPTMRANSEWLPSARPVRSDVRRRSPNSHSSSTNSIAWTGRRPRSSTLMASISRVGIPWKPIETKNATSRRSLSVNRVRDSSPALACEARSMPTSSAPRSPFRPTAEKAM